MRDQVQICKPSMESDGEPPFPTCTLPGACSNCKELESIHFHEVYEKVFDLNGSVIKPGIRVAEVYYKDSNRRIYEGIVEIKECEKSGLSIKIDKAYLYDGTSFTIDKNISYSIKIESQYLVIE